MKKLFISILCCCMASHLVAQKEDETAIRSLLDLESQLYANSPIQEVWEKCWLLDDKTVMNMNSLDGSLIIHDKESLLALPNIVTGIPNALMDRRNFKFDIADNDATVTFETLITLPEEGIKIMSYEIRVLRKIAGQWRVHMTTLHQKLVPN